MQPAANAKPATVPVDTETYVVIRFKGPNGSDPKKLINKPQLNTFINDGRFNWLFLRCYLLNTIPENLIEFYYPAHIFP